LTTQRYELSQECVPFINDLARDATLSYIAHALVCGPASREQALSTHAVHPLAPEFAQDITGSREHLLSGECLRWCTIPNGTVPTDPWLYSLLGATSCLVYGAIVRSQWRDAPYIPSLDHASLASTAQAGHAMLYWHLSYERGNYDDEDDFLRQTAESSGEILEELVRHGIKALGHQAPASHVVVLASIELDLYDRLEKFSFLYGDENDENNPIVWTNTSNYHTAWQHLDAQQGNLTHAIALKPLIDAIESAAANDTDEGDPPDMLFIAELQTTSAPCTPETLLAKVWSECLGLQIIPFDPDDRKALVEHGRQHPELKRHIEPWEEMKRTGSKWANLTHDDLYRKDW
jgi:hypothetical protein